MSLATTNEWYVFDAGTIDKKTCNKIWKAVGQDWLSSTVDISKDITKKKETQVMYLIISQILKYERVILPGVMTSGFMILSGHT